MFNVHARDGSCLYLRRTHFIKKTFYKKNVKCALKSFWRTIAKQRRQLSDCLLHCSQQGRYEKQ